VANLDRTTISFEGRMKMQGTVKWFDMKKGYGFIQPEGGGKDAFVHITAVQAAGLASLDEGQVVEFELLEGRNGKMAAENLKVTG
jgi:CspA family cold shock protein